MSEPPDFEQIARMEPNFVQIAVQIIKSVHLSQERFFKAATTDDILRDIEDRLRQVWNARGVADAQVIEDAYGSLPPSALCERVRRLDR